MGLFSGSVVATAGATAAICFSLLLFDTLKVKEDDILKRKEKSSSKVNQVDREEKYLMVNSTKIQNLITTGCYEQLENWLGEHREQGMHVVCVTNNIAEIYKNGFAEDLVTFRYGGLGGNELMNTLFEFEHAPVREISWEVVFGTEKLSYPNQLPKMYRSDGSQPTVDNDGFFQLENGVWIIFEGGNWRWPPIRKGFERKVPGAILVTESISPAVFFIHVEEEWHVWLRKLVEEWDGQGSKFKEANLRERNAGIGWIPYRGEMNEQILKTSRMVNVPTNRFEDNMQAVRYQEGQYYDAHRDYWDPREFSTQKWTDKHGRWKNRLATILWYIHAPEEGGETWFPQRLQHQITNFKGCDDVGIKVAPKNGTAMLFYSLLADGQLDERSWHCACPVISGKKMVANSWVWSGPYS